MTGPVATGSPRERAAVQDLYPLSPMQKGMLFHTLDEPGSGVYVEQIRIELEGLQPETLRQAWQQLFARHAALRTSIVGTGRAQPAQVVRHEVTLPWREHDLREQPSDEARAAWIEDFLREDGARGFALDEPSLVRLDLIRTGEQRYTLVWTLHHIVLDGWSGSLVLGDLFKIYHALSRAERPALPEVRPYRDYIAWLHGLDPAPAEAYWRENMAGAPSAARLPGDVGVADGAQAVARYARLERTLDAEDLAALSARAASARVTLNTLLQGAWALVLGRSMGDDEVVLGTVSSGRPAALEGVDGMVGMFVNTLPLRVPLPGDASLEDWLSDLQQRQVAQREHETSPLWDVAAWAGVPAGQRLFESLFVFENYPFDATAFEGRGGLSVKITAPFDRTGYPLMLLVTPGQGLRLQLTYDAERFDDAAIERLADHTQSLLRQLGQRAPATLADISLLTEEERQGVLVPWNDTAVPYPDTLCLHELVQAWVAQTPDAPALLCGQQTLTYAELGQAAGRLAQRLQQLGVRRGDRVGLCVERSPEMVVGVLGILNAGAGYVPLDPAHPAERLAYIRADAELAAVVCHGATASVIDAMSAASEGPQLPRVELDADAAELASQPAGAPQTDVTPDDLAYVLYTSGSTGRPKGVAMPHAPLVNLMHWQAEHALVGAGDITLQFAPLVFDVSCQELFATLGTGGSLCLIDEELRRDAGALLELLDERAVARLFLPFVALDQLTRVAVERELFPAALKEVVTAGEQPVVGTALVTFFERLPGCRMENQYGPTEAHVVSAYTLSGPPSEWPRLPPIGQPIANVQLHVLDERMSPVPVGMVGELCIGGAALARGYLGDEAKTAAAFVPNPFSDRPGARLYRTGDRARLGHDGQMVYLGRRDDQVKLRGFRVELGEVEAVAGNLPGVAQAAAVIREERAGDRRLVLYYVPTEGSSPSVSEVLTGLAERLPDVMVPSGAMLLPALPTTGTGKLDRRALLAPGLAPAELRAAHVPPCGPVEELLAELFADVLDVDSPGAHDDFFDLGGHSLKATQLVSRVRAAMQVELPLRALFEHPTISELSAIISARQDDPAQAVPLVAAERSGDQPLSFSQQRLWFLDQMGTGGAYNMPWAFRLDGALEADCLAHAIQSVVDRHEALRTRFVAVDGEPVQRVLPSLEVPLERIDLSGLEPEARDAELARLARDAAETPFDLEAGPLFLPALVRLGPEEHVLFLSLHHIVFDGWSIGVLNRELLEFYRAERDGDEPVVPELSVSYADFVHWQRAWFQGDVLERQLDYWREQLSGDLPVLELATDHPRPAVQNYRGGGVSVSVPVEQTRALRALGRRHGVTLASGTLAVFQALLSRYTGQDDILIGTPVANRTQRELEPLIGFFVNSLVLRADLSGDPTFVQHVRRVHSTALAAYENQDLPFERLVEELAPERDQSRNAIFQVVFAMQNATRDPFSLPGLAIVPLNAGTRATRFDLELHVSETQDGMSAGFCYNRDLFDHATIERLGAHFLTLLDAVLAQPDVALSRLPLLDDTERSTLLKEWNDTARAFPVEAGLHDRFAARVDAAPDAVALCCDGERLSYRELDQRANQVAHLLRGRGVGPDVMVGLCLERGLRQVVGILGVLKAGGGYVPLDLANPSERIAFILEDSGVGLLLTEQAQREALPEHGAELVCFDQDADALAQQPVTRPEPLTRPEHLAYVIYTSGSTGRPKGVLIEHGMVLRLFDASDEHFGFGPDDVWSLFHSCAFDFSVWELWGALLNGGRLVVVPYLVSRETDAFYELLSQEGVTVLSQTPSAFKSLMAADERLADSHPLALRSVIFGGEALDPAMLAPWFDRHGDQRPQLVNMYGITETTVHVTYRALSRADLDAGSRSVIGRPLADLAVYVLDEHAELVPPGVPGEFYVGGAGVARGYLSRPELNVERFVPDPFSAQSGARLYRTGDVGRHLPDGSLEYIGRNDSQVKIRGFRIELGEIEAALIEHPWVSGCVVSLLDDEQGEKRLVGYVVPDHDGADDEQDELVSQWESLYDDTYSGEAADQDFDFNIVGWNSSYTAAPIPPLEMREWVDETVGAILAPAPRRVLEIGCGTGLLMFRVAPAAERYLGCDISQAAIDSVGQHVAARPELADKVELRHGQAHELTDLEPASFDAVLINSVIQYFPSVEYLRTVLELVVAATAEGGRVHVGDVRDLRLLAAYHASVQLFQSESELSLDELSGRVQQHLAQEEELVIDPAFFHALGRSLPRVTRVDVSPKRGEADNELTRFRYQVVLHVGPQPAADSKLEWLDWDRLEGGLDGLVARLTGDGPEQLALRGVPNARTLGPSAAAARLVYGEQNGEATIAGSFREQLSERMAGEGVQPAALCALEATLPYRVTLGWGMDSPDGRFDVIFTRKDLSVDPAFPAPPAQQRPWTHYGNHPLQAIMTRKLAPRLRDALDQRLPGYMVPAAFVMLESLPLTANGKVDRRALPDPSWFLSQSQATFREPNSETERGLAAIWCDLLGVAQAGLDDDFFDLGGHSLLATRVLARVRETWRVELGLAALFELPTIALLAQQIDALAGLGDGPPDGGGDDDDRESGEL